MLEFQKATTSPALSEFQTGPPATVTVPDVSANVRVGVGAPVLHVLAGAAAVRTTG